MDFLKRVFSFILNPRVSAAAYPGITGAAGKSGEFDALDDARRRSFLRAALTNFPLMLGSLIVLGLFLLILFGPLWAPRNPYIAGEHIVPHFNTQKGEWISPPLEPSAEYPLGTDQWGNDILSLLLYGARNTLVACAFITMVRVFLGLSLGAFAGWNEG